MCFTFWKEGFNETLQRVTDTEKTVQCSPAVPEDWITAGGYALPACVNEDMNQHQDFMHCFALCGPTPLAYSEPRGSPDVFASRSEGSLSLSEFEARVTPFPQRLTPIPARALLDCEVE